MRVIATCMPRTLAQMCPAGAGPVGLLVPIVLFDKADPGAGLCFYAKKNALVECCQILEADNAVCWENRPGDGGRSRGIGRAHGSRIRRRRRPTIAVNWLDDQGAAEQVANQVRGCGRACHPGEGGRGSDRNRSGRWYWLL